MQPSPSSDSMSARRSRRFARLVTCLLASVLLPLLGCRTSAAPPHVSGDDGRLNVALLVVDGVYNTELTAPLDIFQHTIFHVEPGMRTFTVGPDRSPITSFEGLRILPDYGYDECPRVDVLVVPSAEHSMDSDLEDEAMMRFVREKGAEAEWLVSLCDGAFVLAAAGLLDGHRATTFPSDRARLREMFPRVEVLEDVSFVHDRRAITSAGGALSFDPALYLCELLYGAEKARGIARGLVIDWDLASVPHDRAP